jgi:predicted FMN-binding regulatory protein PaiB
MLVGKSKLSQNKAAQDMRRAGVALSARENHQTGGAMQALAAGKPE